MFGAVHINKLRGDLGELAMFHGLLDAVNIDKLPGDLSALSIFHWPYFIGCCI